MIRHLHISNLALLEECDVELGEGMIALTGETGAGKSLLMESIGLLAGSRATPSLVRSGEERATVEALFEAQGNTGLAALLREHGLEGDGSGEIIIRREIAASGRSRATVNGRMVPLAQLLEIASHLLEVGAQHDQVTLLQPARQRELFDEAAGTTGLAAQVKAAWTEMQALRRELEALTGEDRLREQRLELLRFQLKELEEAALEPGELDQLLAERTRLANRERLVALTGLGAACLSEAPPGESSAADLLARALGAVEEAAELDAELAPLREELATAQTVLGEVAYSLTKYLSRSEADPERLQEIEERVQSIKRVLKKHGPTEVDALRALDEIRAELESEDSRDQRGADLVVALEKGERALEGLVLDLSAARARAIDGFCKPLVATLRDFAMPKVRFTVQLSPVTGGVTLPGGIMANADGGEEVEFLFSANDGEAMQPLRRVASGGELSRVLLALRTLGAESSRVPLLVFDEVDAGLSGVAARRVGERLAALSRRAQVICVTHNASVASLASQHLLVEKRHAGGRTVSTVEPVEGLRREEEVARLLDGGKISGKGLALAAELLTRAG